MRNVALQMASTVGMSRTDRVAHEWTSDVGHTYAVTVRGKAVSDAVKADLARPVDVSPEFAAQLPAPVSSAESNQLRITDAGDAHLSGAKQAQLVGPGGKVTIDASGITIEGVSIRLKSPVISMTGGGADGLPPVTEADCAECAKKTTSSHPVDVATGQKVLVQHDFTLPGRIPIRWGRSYRSADQRAGSLGIAWKLPYATEIRRSATGLVYFDADGRQLQFPALEAGQDHFHAIEKYTLVRDVDSATFIVRFGNGVEEHYAPHPNDDARWQLQRVTNRDGHVLLLGYTPKGYLREVRNNVHAVHCILDDAGRITQVLLGDMCLASYVYDAQGDLIEATNRAGLTWRYAYRRHLLTHYRTPAGATHICEWAGDTPQARVTRTFAYVDDNKRITRDTRFTYLPGASTTRVTDGLGRTTEYHYNGLWAVDRVLYSDGAIRQTHFDETGSISGYTDELGRATRIVNDTRGNATTIIDAAGNVTRVSYDELNQPIQIADPAGQLWQRAYDDAGHLVTETDPLGNTTSYAYRDGMPVTRTDALGNVTRMQWDGAGQMIARTDCSGHTTRYDYDTLGNLTQTTDALGHASFYATSGAGRFTGYQPAGMGWWRIDYDEAGRAVAHRDPLKRITRTEWDAYDQRLAVIDPAGGAQRFEYDPIGRVTALHNANGDTTTFTYDSRDRLIEQTGFDGRRQSFRYNAAGEMTTRTDHGDDGQIITDITYDVLGRAIERRASDGSQASYRYDARGLLTQAQASSPGQTPSQITFEYDAGGRRTAEVQAHHGRVWRLAHELNALGHRTASRMPGVGTLAWQRYGSGHVHGVLLDGAALASFERDALHRETVRVQGPAAHHYGYGPTGQLAQHQWQNLDARGRALESPRAWRNWSHDESGQITALRDAWRGEKQYRYDPLARLISVNGGRAGDEAFAYDAAGNLLAVGHAGWIGRAEGDRLQALVTPEVAAPQALLYEHDGHGNRTTRTVPLPPVPEPTAKDSFIRVMDTITGVQPKATPEPRPHVTRYRYDGAHQLAAIDHDDGARSRYTYDALGRRIAKEHASADGVQKTTLFVWDGDWMMQEVHAGDTARDDRQIVYVPHPDHAGPLAKLEGGVVFHYVTDHLGTPQELYDDQRKVVWAAEFSAYGKMRHCFAREVENPIRLPGQYYDVESGLCYNRFRYYDAQAGRYVNQDPIGLLGGANKYAYVRSLPVRRVDPLGLQALAGFSGAEAIRQQVSLAQWMQDNGASQDDIGKVLASSPNPGARSIGDAWRDFHGSVSVDGGISGHVAAGGGAAVGIAFSKAREDALPDACLYLNLSQTAGPGAAGGLAVSTTLSSSPTITGRSLSYGGFATGGLLAKGGGSVQTDSVNLLNATSGSISGSVGVGAGTAAGLIASQQYSLCLRH
ncbi:hypothetical protein NK8_01350 [Caballeronia sp. NK8]|uniref:RHS repeat-associated core domain-containing protein n=1 Tax=Caballeronia sp. NK8 TaxID=140098 RepID=UPI001BB4F497|nr:hypothetical protein NK8_01350 [Caballeronia sp. NK8]